MSGRDAESNSGKEIPIKLNWGLFGFREQFPKHKNNKKVGCSGFFFFFFFQTSQTSFLMIQLFGHCDMNSKVEACFFYSHNSLIGIVNMLHSPSACFCIVI